MTLPIPLESIIICFFGVASVILGILWIRNTQRLIPPEISSLQNQYKNYILVYWKRPSGCSCGNDLSSLVKSAKDKNLHTFIIFKSEIPPEINLDKSAYDVLKVGFDPKIWNDYNDTIAIRVNSGKVERIISGNIFTDGVFK